MFCKNKREDGDEQIDQHDGRYQNVDKEQCQCEPRSFRTTCNIRVIQVDSTVVAAVINVA